MNYDKLDSYFYNIYYSKTFPAWVEFVMGYNSLEWGFVDLDDYLGEEFK